MSRLTRFFMAGLFVSFPLQACSAAAASNALDRAGDDMTRIHLRDVIADAGRILEVD